MSQTSWESLFNNEGYSQLNTGTALSNSVALTDISPGGNTAGQACVIPASFLYTGMQLRVVAHGVFQTTGSTSLTLGIYYGGVAGTALATATFGASANASSNSNWDLEADIRVESVGTSASLRTQGRIQGIASYGTVMIPQTGLGTATVASGASNILTIGAQWGAANASNSIQVLSFLVESLN